MHLALHAKLSTYYAIYFATVGAWVPFWPLYLAYQGYSPAQIGLTLSATACMRLLVPVAWGWIMDRTGRRMPWISGAMFLCAALYACLPFADSFVWLVALHVAYAIFWNASLPAFEVVTLNHLARTGFDYSRIRLWGSIGFVAAVLVLGPMLDLVGIAPLPWIIVGAMLAMALLGLWIEDAHDLRQNTIEISSFLRRLSQPAILALLLATFLSQLSFAPFYSFFSIFLEANGYSGTTIGVLWALGVFAEVVVFLFTGQIIKRFGSRLILLVALLSTAVRWVLLAQFVDSTPILAISQTLHFLSFGVYHAVTIHYINELFPGRLQGRGQALLAAVSFGLGGSLGHVLAGNAWESLGPVQVYMGSAVIAFLGAGAALFAPALKPSKPGPEENSITPAERL